MLTSAQTAVHVVTLLEEMPVQETVDAVVELRAARLPVGAVVINQVREPLLRTRELASAAKGTIKRGPVRTGLEAAGLRVTDALVEGLLAEAHDHALRVAQESEQLGRLHHLDLPLFQLPANPEGVDASTVREFADLLTERGWPSSGPAAR
jgi:anion-transporting  ArsA/GET3 family ATPase